ncbi:serine protease, putative [Ixodes scapularis]|uniref:Serine protease, putative n=1 Tax=Ixodes scapularis TaxID=6945 RepID=B7Q4H1_IXOSC|nr:serine protease, putative [Ixodes scapularis]|eukprot:XP_002400458.1 serine protease, putative [Ixodes scapularis]
MMAQVFVAKLFVISILMKAARLGQTASTPEIRAAQENGAQPSTLQPPEGRVYNGRDAQPGEFPWMVKILMPTGYCGGAIITKTHVLTAAHCFDGYLAGPIEVIAGLLCPKKHTVTHIQRHELYVIGPQDTTYDLAILKVAPEFEFTKEVYPVKIPVEGMEVSGTVAVSGFGTTHAEPGPVKSLQTTILTVVPSDRCGYPPNIICTEVDQTAVCPVSTC